MSSAPGLNSLLDRFAPFRRGKGRFLFAALSILCTFVLAAVCQGLFGSVAPVLFALTVGVCTGLFGLLAGLLSAAAAALAIYFLTVPAPFHAGSDLLLWLFGFGALAAGVHAVERRISANIRSQIKPPLGVHGSMDGLVDGELYGWALDADHPSDAVVVTVSIDERPVAQVAAVYYRPDVATSMNCSGRNGFYVDLAPYFTTDCEARVDVRLPNGAWLANTPARLQVAAVHPRLPRPTLLFMHIPKTAGTAFREVMAAHFLQSEIAYIYPEPPGFLVTDLRALPLEQRRGFRVVIGHFQFGMHEALPQKSEYITIVREPAARVLSQYAYARQTQPELIRREDGTFMSLVEVFEKRLTVDFDNAIVRCFSGVDQRDYPPGRLTQEIFDRAVHNLHSAFAFVGHQEAAESAYASLRALYGWNSGDALPSANRGTVRLDRELDGEVQAAIRHYNSWDFLFYKEILRLYPLARAATPETDADALRVGPEIKRLLS